jgi:hypothetical protein
VEVEQCGVERRGDGAILVRVRSPERDGTRLPDAVFAFRSGDPQYKYWAHQWEVRHRDTAADA